MSGFGGDILSLDEDDPVAVQLRASRRQTGRRGCIQRSGQPADAVRFDIHAASVRSRNPEPGHCNLARAVGDSGDRLFIARLFRRAPQPYAGADRCPVRR